MGTLRKAIVDGFSTHCSPDSSWETSSILKKINRSLDDFLCILVHAKLFFPRAPKGCSQKCLMVLYPPQILFTSSHSRRMKSCRLTIILGRYNFTKKYLWKNRPEDFRHPDAVFKNDLLGLVRKSFFKFRLVSKIFLGYSLQDTPEHCRKPVCQGERYRT